MIQLELVGSFSQLACGEFFDWLHLDFEALSIQASRYGWVAEKLLQEENGHYLARLIDTDHRAT